MIRTFLLLNLSLLAALAAVDQVPSIGYRGDMRRSLSVDGPMPPVSCDGEKGTNIRWRAPLPNWGYGQPIIVAGKVFVTTEGGHVAGRDFPTLHCFDLKSGKELWEYQLDHLDKTGHAGAAKDWAAKMADYRELYTLFNNWKSGDAAAKQATEAKWAEIGYNFKGWKKGYGALRSLSWKGGKKDPKNKNNLTQACKDAGLGLDSWQHLCGMGLACFGQSFSTPVSDGEAVYVVTAFDSVWKFDFDGKLMWVKLDKAGRGEYCRTGRSPLIWQDYLMVHMNNRLRAFDRTTGKTAWSHDWDTHAWMSPAVITVGDTDIILCAQKKAFRLADGKELTIVGGSDFGACTSVMTDSPDVSFHTGSGEHCGWTKKGAGPPPSPTAVRWTLEGDTLKGEVLWAGLNGKKAGGHTGLTYHQGRLFHMYAALEPLTFKTLAGKVNDKKAGSFKSKHLLWGVGDRLYGLANHYGKKTGKKGADLVCYDLNGKKLATSFLPSAEVDSAKRELIIAQSGYSEWQKGFSYSSSFTIGEGCIVVHGVDDLWCIAK